ncbi:MAG: methyltransferase domain-containing protein [Chitinophagaceae bacterium]
MDRLNEDFWDQRYLMSQTGWDLGGICPALKDFFDQLPAKNLRILIPGAGNSYEAEYLRNLGFHQITVLDISFVVTEQVKTKFSAFPDFLPKVICMDFFQHQGEYDLIVEQTFFSALEPALRPTYFQKMRSLLAPGGQLAGLLFERSFDPPGPPFGGSLPEYQLLWAPYFEPLRMGPCLSSHPSREGTEVFFQLISKDIPS